MESEMRRSLVMVVMAAGVMVGASAVLGHAFLDYGDPKVGSEVVAPAEVKVFFTADVDVAKSKVTVTDAKGVEVDKKDLHGDEKDKTELVVSVADLEPGKYKVVWEVVATVDGHKTQGEYTFTVKAGAATRAAETERAATRGN